MATEIQRTTITPAADGDVVELHISDALLGNESATIVLGITVRIPKFRPPLLSHVQREAVGIAVNVLSEHLEDLARQIRSVDGDLRPTVLES